MTDSVTGLLPQPSWLANWLHTAPSQEEAEDSEVEDREDSQAASNGSSIVRVDPAPDTSSNTGSFIFRRPPGACNDQSNGKGIFTSTCNHPSNISVKYL